MTPRHLPALAAIACLAVAGCARTRYVETIQPLPPAPVAPVQQSALPPVNPPPGTTPPGTTAEQQPLNQPPAGQQVASTSPTAPAPTSGVSIGRTDLLGGWAVTSAGETCQLFMSLTQWTGGYRASTRGCSQPALAGISAWQLNGKEITLKGNGGATVATLAANSSTNFNGTTAGGKAITVSR